MWKSLAVFVVLVAMASGVAGAVTGDSRPLYIYKNYDDPANHGAWANVMPARAAEINAVILRTKNEPGLHGSGTSVRVQFDLNQPPNWAGIVVAVQPDYWGEWPAIGLDLSKARKLVFWARGEAGGEQIQVKAAIAGDKRYGDSAVVPVTTPWLALEKGWKKYEVPVDASQLERVITPFVVVVNRSYNPSGTITVYLDEIYYEMGN